MIINLFKKDIDYTLRFSVYKYIGKKKDTIKFRITFLFMLSLSILYIIISFRKQI